MRYALTAAALVLLAAAPAWAQGQTQQMTQPSASQNQSQAAQNQSEQPGNVRQVSPTVPTATENSVTKPQGPVSGPTSQAPNGKSK